MKSTLFISALCSVIYGGAASAADYVNTPLGPTILVNEAAIENVRFEKVVSTENGGAIRVESGSSSVSSGTFIQVYSLGEGGAAYVGEGATLELRGNTRFSGNAAHAVENSGIYTGDWNDVYIARDAELLLNPARGEHISLESGLSSQDATARFTKKGAGTACIGAGADNAFFQGSMEVQAGTLQLASDIVASGVVVTSEAALQVSGAALGVGEGGLPGISLAAKSAGAPAALSGAVLSRNSMGEHATAEQALAQNAYLTVDHMGGIVSVNNLRLEGSMLDIYTPARLSNLSLDAASSANATGTTATLYGSNTLTLRNAASSQLAGITLADGCNLTLNLTKDLAETLDLEEGERTTITLLGSNVEQGATLQFQEGIILGTDMLTAVEAYDATAGGIRLTMSAISAHPATISLGLNNSRSYTAIRRMMSEQGADILAMGTAFSGAVAAVAATREEAVLERLLNQLGGAEYAVLMGNQMEGNLAHLRLLRQLAGTGSMLTNGKRGSDWYAHAFNSTTDWDTDARGCGFRREEWGAIMGTERTITRYFYLGADLSASRAEITPGAGSETWNQDSLNADVYADYRSNGWRSLTSFGVGLHCFDLSRCQPDMHARSTAETDGLSLNFMQEISYRMQLEEGSYLQAFLSIDSSWNRIDSFSESGALSLSVQEQDAWATEVSLGLRYSSRFHVLPEAPPALWSLQTGAVASVGDTTADTTTSFTAIPGYSFLQSSADRGRWGWSIGSSLALPLSDRAALFGSAEGILRSDTTQFEAQIGLRYSF